MPQSWPWLRLGVEGKEGWLQQGVQTASCPQEGPCVIAGPGEGGVGVDLAVL